MTHVFTYAENYDSPIQQLCLESFRRHNPQGTVYTPQTFRGLDGAEEIWQLTAPLSPYHRSDVIRLFLLERYGGLWIDADCVHLRQAEFPYDIRPDQLGVCLNSDKSDEIANTILYAPRPGLPLVTKLIERQKDLIEQKGVQMPWLDLGSWNIDFFRARNPRDIFVAPHWEFMYLPWFDKERFLLEHDDWGFELDRRFYNPNAYCYHLTHPVLEWTAGHSRQACLESKSFLGFLWRRGFGLGWDGLRIKEILSRLPNLHERYQFVEIGVHRGDVSRIVGQQRCHATVHLVDPWEHQPADSTYHRSGDPLAGLTDCQQEALYLDCRERVWFLLSQQRANILREYSTDAAPRFPDHSVDMVFIDADHSHEGCWNDIHLWLPKVKSGGWICGHDYNNPSFPGVTTAVQDWAGSSDRIETGDDMTWFVKVE